MGVFIPDISTFEVYLLNRFSAALLFALEGRDNHILELEPVLFVWCQG